MTFEVHVQQMASTEDNGINHYKVQVMSSSNKPCETNRPLKKEVPLYEQEKRCPWNLRNK